MTNMNLRKEKNMYYESYEQNIQQKKTPISEYAMINKQPLNERPANFTTGSI